MLDDRAQALKIGTTDVTRPSTPLARMETRRETSLVGPARRRPWARPAKRHTTCESEGDLSRGGTVIFIVVKAARMLGEALNGMRFGVPFHQHCECGE
jgi:hypothetical protein